MFIVSRVNNASEITAVYFYREGAKGAEFAKGKSHPLRLIDTDEHG